MICPKCKKELIRIGNTYQCENHHSYDISKSGYINLLLNGKNSGDNKEMINARNQFLNKNYYLPLKEKIDDIIKTLNLKHIIDIGCGDGYFDKGIDNLVGVDISKEAIMKASKNNKKGFYIVSSGFNLPFSDNEFDLIINIFAPHDEKEFTRICNKYILKVVPNKNHLIELKQLLYNDVHLKEEKHLNFKDFKEIKEYKVTYQVVIDDLYELVLMTPYFYTSNINKDLLDSNKRTLITCDFSILLYEKII